MSNEIASVPAQADSASPAAEVSPTPETVTSGAPPTEGTSAETPAGERPRAQERIEQARSEGKAAGEKAFAKAREEERLRGMNDQFAVRSQQFADKNPDYLTVISNPALTFMNVEFLEVIKSSEKGPELAFHIGKDPKLVARLAGKSVPQRLTELGRIEADLSRPAPPPKVTAAPAPPTPIGGGAGGQVDPSKLSPDDWLAWRPKDIH